MKMNWKQQTVIRILIIITKFFVEDDNIRKEIESLDNHIRYGDRRLPE